MAKNTETTITVKGRYVGGGLFEPRSMEEGKDPRYSACVILEKGEEQKVDGIVKNCIEEKWGTKRPAGLQEWGAREGDDPSFEASFGAMYINPKSTKSVKTCVKREGLFETVTKDDDLLYPGCYVAVSISAYGYDGNKEKKIKPGVTLNLRAVMFWKHGERLSDVVNTEEEFADMESEIEVDDIFGDVA